MGAKCPRGEQGEVLDHTAKVKSPSHGRTKLEDGRKRGRGGCSFLLNLYYTLFQQSIVFSHFNIF